MSAKNPKPPLLIPINGTLNSEACLATVNMVPSPPTTIIKSTVLKNKLLGKIFFSLFLKNIFDLIPKNTRTNYVELISPR